MGILKAVSKLWGGPKVNNNKPKTGIRIYNNGDCDDDNNSDGVEEDDGEGEEEEEEDEEYIRTMRDPGYSDDYSSDSESSVVPLYANGVDEKQTYYDLKVRISVLQMELLYTRNDYNLASSKRKNAYKRINDLMASNGYKRCEKESDVKTGLMNMFSDNDMDAKIEFTQIFNIYVPLKDECKMLNMTIEELSGNFRTACFNMTMENAAIKRKMINGYKVSTVTNKKQFIESHNAIVKRASSHRTQKRTVFAAKDANFMASDLTEYYDDVKKKNASTLLLGRKRLKPKTVERQVVLRHE